MSTKDSKLATRFGSYADLLEGGYTPILNDLLSHLGELAISPLEFTTIAVVLGFQKSPKWSFPSRKRVSKCIGVSEVTIKRAILSLTQKGFLRRESLGKGRAKTWDFSGLFERLREFRSDKPLISGSSVTLKQVEPKESLVSGSSVTLCTKESLVSGSSVNTYRVKSDPLLVSGSSVTHEQVEQEERTITTTTGDPRNFSSNPKEVFPKQDSVVVVRDISQQIKQLQQQLESMPYDPFKSEDSEGSRLKLILRLLELTQAPGGREEVEQWVEKHGQEEIKRIAGVCKEKVQSGEIPTEKAYDFFLKALQEKDFLFIQEVVSLTAAKPEEVKSWILEHGEQRVRAVVEACRRKQQRGEIKSSCYGFCRGALAEAWEVKDTTKPPPHIASGIPVIR